MINNRNQKTREKNADSSKYRNELTEYFRLKDKYDKRLESEKMSIMKNQDLTAREKRQKYQQYKPRCVNCRQTGGTIFSQKSNVYRAVCGNTEKPCNLKIQIVRRQRELLPELIEKYMRELESIKSSIMKAKLDYIFEYNGEEESVEYFNSLKKSLGDTTDRYNDLYMDYINMTTNSDDERADIRGQREDSIRELKSRIQLYNNTGNVHYVVEATELYLQDITRLNGLLQELQWSLYEVETIDDKHYLVREGMSRHDLEVDVKN